MSASCPRALCNVFWLWFFRLQKTNKKLLEDSKKYSKSVKEVALLEVKLLSNLQNVGAFRDDEDVKEVLDGHQCIANFVSHS